MVQSTSRVYKTYVCLVAVFLIGGSFYSFYIRRDSFPFAAFLMYSSKQESQEFYLLKSFCQKGEGAPIAVSEFDTWEQEVDYYEGLSGRAELPLSEENMKDCHQVLTRMLANLSYNGCRKIILNRYYWKNFSGPIAQTPDKTETLCEVELRDGL